jgi:glycosyltransferase involved in cell wall biosynthesis
MRERQMGSGEDLRVLVVSADFPFPPRWGFAMRVYQLARHLANRHDVTLLSYATPADAEGIEALRRELTVEVVPRAHVSQSAKRLTQLASVASGLPFASRAVYSAAMQRAITDLCTTHRFDVVQVESSLLCGFRFPPGSKLILDEHNIEYELFHRMQEGERSLARRSYYRVEHARSRRFEQRWWRQAAGCAVTSEREEQIVRRHAPSTPVAVVPNGVDLEHFRPDAGATEPCTMVFNGLLQYRPNLDAAYFLVDEVWPRILARCPGARLEIVGRGDAIDLQRLERPGVVVTGEVPDVRPHLERAVVVAVPIRMGGGTRLKVVEGLAMGKAMVSTSLGCEGIDVHDGQHLLVADTAEEFAAAVARLFDDPGSARALGLAGRARMERDYSWSLAAERMDALYRRVVTGEAADREPEPHLVGVGAGLS